MKRIHFTLCIAACLAMVLGCGEGGPTLGKVTGKVTLDGKPLPDVAVTFMPTEGGSGSGFTDAQGNYELTHTNGRGTPVGKNKVAVTTVNKPQSAVDMSQVPSDSPEYAKMAAGGGGDYNVKFTEPIPAKYNVKTELQFDIKSGSQVINLELKSS